MKATFLNISHLKNISDGAERIRFTLLLLFVFSLPYSIFYSSVILLTLCATTLLDLRLEKFRQIPRQVWLFQLIYFLGLMGYFYSYDKSGASFLLERQLAILVLPCLIPLAITMNEEKVRLMLTMLVITSLCATCYLFISMFCTIVFQLQMPLLTTAFSGAFFNHQFSKPLNIHAGYLSLYLSLSILYLVFLFNRRSFFYNRLLLIVAMAILFAGLFFLASRNSIIATFFIILFIFPLYKTKHKLRYIMVSLLCVLAGLLVVNYVPYLKKRFSVELLTEIRPLNGTYVNYSAEPRIDRWMGALALVKKSPLRGYGTGDEIGILKTEYIRRGLYISYVENFNAHNQYLSYLLKNGIPGLCIFLLAFIYYLQLALRHRQFMYLAFLLLLLIGFYTENILDANKGIFFFALFNTLFGYTILLKEKEAEKPGA